MLSQWIPRYLLFLRAERSASPHTLRAYSFDLGHFRAFVTEKYPEPSALQTTTRLIVRDYLSVLHQQGHERATLLRAIAVLRAFFKYLVREEILPQTPFVGLPMPKREKRLPHFLSEPEMLR